MTKASLNVVTLRLGGELMAIPADGLREILEPAGVTRVPNADPFVAGLINVRGAVVPLADLRIPFGMDPGEPTDDTRILVLDLDLGGERSTVAITADRVHDVTELDAGSIGQVPDVGIRLPPEFIRGIGKWQEEFVLLPNLERVFTQRLALGAGAGTGAHEEGQRECV